MTDRPKTVRITVDINPNMAYTLAETSKFLGVPEKDTIEYGITLIGTVCMLIGQRESHVDEALGTIHSASDDDHG